MIGAIVQSTLQDRCANLVETVQGKYERRKEGVSEEMEVEAGKLEQDVEEDFGPGRFAR